jgi:hypothetical protein
LKNEFANQNIKRAMAEDCDSQGIKLLVWCYYNGPNVTARCWCCKFDITDTNFYCGRMADSQGNTVENVRPVCQRCYLMGSIEAALHAKQCLADKVENFGSQFKKCIADINKLKANRQAEQTEIANLEDDIMSILPIWRIQTDDEISELCGKLEIQRQKLNQLMEKFKNQWAVYQD